MGTTMIEKIARVEARLQQKLPTAYRNYLLNPDNATSEIVAYFLHAESGQDVSVDWDADFPYTLSQQPEWPSDSLTTIGDEEDFSDEQLEKYYRELSDYLDNNYVRPTGQGSVLINEEGCGEFSILILRGLSRGEVWRREITFEEVIVTPRCHPVTKQVLHFDQWLELQREPYRLTTLAKKQIGGIYSYPRISREGKMAMQYHFACTELRGIDLLQIAGLKRIADIPEDAEFLDPYTHNWESLRAAIPVSWAHGITLR